MQKSLPGSAEARKRIRRLQNRIRRFDLVCAGTLHVRTKVCGKPGCRCATDPQKRHGPYHEWSRLEEGRLVHTLLTAAEARSLQRALANQHKINQILKAWQDLSITIIRQAQPTRVPGKKSKKSIP
jgi:hypothetical protein